MNIFSLAINNFSVKAKIDLFNYLNGKVQKSIIQGHTKLAYHGLQGCHPFISYKLKISNIQDFCTTSYIEKFI